MEQRRLFRRLTSPCVARVQYRAGFYVPDYSAEAAGGPLTSYTALAPPVQQLLGGVVHVDEVGEELVCDPGSGVLSNIEELGNYTCNVHRGSNSVADYIASAYDEGTPFLAYMWSPNAALAAYNLTRVALPPFTDSCWASHAERGMSCDFPTVVPNKVAWVNARDFFPPGVFDVLRKLRMTTSDFNSLLLQAVDPASGNVTAAGLTDALCSWSAPRLSWLQSLVARIDVTDLHPRTGPVSGGTMVVVFGSGFGVARPPSVSVVLEGIEVDAEWVSSTELRFLTPPGIGRDVHGEVRLGSRRSATFQLFSYNAAVLRGVTVVGATSTGREVVAGQVLRCSGDGFVSTEKLACRFDSVVVQGDFVDSNNIECTAPYVPFGFSQLYVTNDGERWSDGFELNKQIVWPDGASNRVPLGFARASAPERVAILAVLPTSHGLGSACARTFTAAIAALHDARTALDEPVDNPLAAGLGSVKGVLLPYTEVVGVLLDIDDDVLVGPVAGMVTAILKAVDEAAASLGEGVPIVGLIGSQISSLTEACSRAAVQRRIAHLGMADMTPHLADGVEAVQRGEGVTLALQPPAGPQGTALVFTLHALRTFFINDGMWAPGTDGVAGHNIAVIYDSGTGAFKALLAAMQTAAIPHSIDVHAEALPADMSDPSSEELARVMRSATEASDVLIVLADVPRARNILMALHMLGLHPAPNRVTLGPDQMSSGDFEGYRAVFGAVGLQDGFDHVDMWDEDAVREALDDGSGRWATFLQDSALVQDGVVALALAVDDVVREGRASELSSQEAAPLVVGALREVSFEGASGPVAWSVSTSERLVETDGDSLESGAVDPFVDEWRQVSPARSIVSFAEDGSSRVVGEFVTDTGDVRLTGEIFRPPTTPGGEIRLWRMVVPDEMIVGIALPFAQSDVDGISECYTCQLVVLAVEEAVHAINESPNILPDTRLKVLIGDSRETAEDAYTLAHRLFDEGAVIVVGSIFSSLTIGLADAAAERDKPILGYGATSPLLSPPEAYPFFRRIVAADTLQGEFAADLVRRFNWLRVAVIGEDETYSRGLTEVFVSACEEVQVSVAFSRTLPTGVGSIQHGNRIGRDAVRNMLLELRDSGVRVVFVGTLEVAARIVFATAAHLGMVGGEFVWLGADGWAFPIWSGSWEADGMPASENIAPVTPDSVAQGAEGSIGIRPSAGNAEAVADLQQRVTATSFTGTDAVDAAADVSYYPPSLRSAVDQWRFSDETVVAPPFYMFYAYDAVLFAADAANSMLVERQSLDDGHRFIDALQTTVTQGVSGVVSLVKDVNSRANQAYDLVNIHDSNLTVVGLISERGFVEYSLCQPGQYRGATADGRPGECIPCPEDTYSDVVGDGACTQCPSVGDARRSTNFKTGASSEAACLCPVGYYVAHNSSDCVFCPSTAVCPTVGLPLAEVYTSPGFWRLHPAATAYVECEQAHHCGSGIPVEVNETQVVDAPRSAWYFKGTAYTWSNCTGGHSGLLCRVCASGYVLNVLDDDSCVQCPSVAQNVGLLTLGALVLLAVVIVMTRQVMRIDPLSKRMSNNAKVLISWSHFNTLALSFQQHARSEIVGLLQMQQFVSRPSVRGVIGISCLLPVGFSSFGSTFAVMMSLLPAAALSFVVFRLCFRAWTRRQLSLMEQKFGKDVMTLAAAPKLTGSGGKPLSPAVVQARREYATFKVQKHDLTDRSIVFVSVSAFLIYPSLVESVFRAFGCTSVADGNGSSVRYLEADPALDCDSAEYRQYRYWAFVFFVLYVVGLPVLGITVLRRYRSYLHLSSKPGAENLTFDESILDLLYVRSQLFCIEGEEHMDLLMRTDVVDSFCRVVAGEFEEAAAAAREAASKQQRPGSIAVRRGGRDRGGGAGLARGRASADSQRRGSLTKATNALAPTVPQRRPRSNTMDALTGEVQPYFTLTADGADGGRAELKESAGGEAKADVFPAADSRRSRRSSITASGVAEKTVATVKLDIDTTLRVMRVLRDEACLRVARGAVPTRAIASTLQRFRAVFRVQRRFGFLYTAYKPQTALWEGVIVARKIAISAATVGLANASEAGRLAAATTIVLVSLYLTIVYRPFSEQNDVATLPRLASRREDDDGEDQEGRSVPRNAAQRQSSRSSLRPSKLYAPRKAEPVAKRTEPRNKGVVGSARSSATAAKSALLRLANSTKDLEVWSLLVTFGTLTASQLYDDDGDSSAWWMPWWNSVLTFILLTANFVIVSALLACVMQDYILGRVLVFCTRLRLSCAKCCDGRRSARQYFDMSGKEAQNEPSRTAVLNPLVRDPAPGEADRKSHPKRSRERRIVTASHARRPSVDTGAPETLRSRGSWWDRVVTLCCGLIVAPVTLSRFVGDATLWPSRVKRVPFVLYCATNFALGMVHSMGPVLPLLREQVSGTVETLSLALGARALGAIFAGTGVGGRLFDAFSSSSLFLSCVLGVTCAATFGLVTVTSELSLFGMFFSLGACHGAMDLCTTSCVLWLYGDDSGPPLSLMNLWQAFGALFAPLLAGLTLVELGDVAAPLLQIEASLCGFIAFLCLFSPSPSAPAPSKILAATHGGDDEDRDSSRPSAGTASETTLADLRAWLKANNVEPEPTAFEAYADEDMPFSDVSRVNKTPGVLGISLHRLASAVTGRANVRDVSRLADRRRVEAAGLSPRSQASKPAKHLSRELSADSRAAWRASESVQIVIRRLVAGLGSVFLLGSMGVKLSVSMWLAGYVDEVYPVQSTTELNSDGSVATTAAVGAFVTAAFYGSYVVAKIVNVRLAATIKPHRALVACTALTSAVAAILGASHGTDVAILYVGATLMGIGTAIPFPATFSLPVEAGVAVKSRLVALLLGGEYVGELIVPILVGESIDAYGWVALMWVTAGVTLLSCIVAVLITWSIFTDGGLSAMIRCCRAKRPQRLRSQDGVELQDV